MQGFGMVYDRGHRLVMDTTDRGAELLTGIDMMKSLTRVDDHVMAAAMRDSGDNLRLHD